LQAETKARLEVGRYFYLAMSIVLAGIVVYGFSQTVPSDFTPPGLPLLLKFHAAVFFSWILLSVVQPALIVGGSRALHRRIGWIGTGLALAMVGMGASAILLGLWSGQVPPFYPHGLFIKRGFVGLLVFAALVSTGVVMRRHAPWHKRLLLCATIVIITPGLERAMPLFLFGDAWPYAVDGTIDLLALAGPVFDLVTLRRVHPAYLVGIGAILLGQVAVDLLAPSSVATALLHAFGTK
jgi:hypothetical protein